MSKTDGASLKTTKLHVETAKQEEFPARISFTRKATLFVINIRRTKMTETTHILVRAQEILSIDETDELNATFSASSFELELPSKTILRVICRFQSTDDGTSNVVFGRDSILEGT